jgi:hypothetical protein
MAKQGLRFSPAVEAVIMRGLEREPGRRFPDCVAFAQALREAIAQPVEPQHVGMMGRLKSLLIKKH